MQLEDSSERFNVWMNYIGIIYFGAGSIVVVVTSQFHFGPHIVLGAFTVRAFCRTETTTIDLTRPDERNKFVFGFKRYIFESGTYSEAR